jgi:hypothetical protein
LYFSAFEGLVEGLHLFLRRAVVAGGRGLTSGSYVFGSKTLVGYLGTEPREAVIVLADGHC